MGTVVRRKTTYQLSVTIEGTAQAQRVVCQALEYAIAGVIYNDPKIDQLLDSGRITLIDEIGFGPLRAVRPKVDTPVLEDPE